MHSSHLDPVTSLSAPDIHRMKTLAWVIATLIFIISNTVQGDEDGDMVTRRHHEDDVINEKMERYEELLKRKRDVIDKFLKDNYSDFNHSDYTPEVMTFIYDFMASSGAQGVCVSVLVKSTQSCY